MSPKTVARLGQTLEDLPNETHAIEVNTGIVRLAHANTENVRLTRR